MRFTKLKTSGFYATNYDGHIAYSGDIMACKRAANRKLRDYTILALEYGIYDADACGIDFCGRIVPKADAKAIWLYRHGEWHTNPEYIY